MASTFGVGQQETVSVDFVRRLFIWSFDWLSDARGKVLCGGNNNNNNNMHITISFKYVASV